MEPVSFMPSFAPLLSQSPAGDATPDGARVVEEHDAAGRLVARASFAGGQPHGRMERYGAQGVPLLAADYIDGRLEGWVRIHDADGAIALEALHAAGVPNGPCDIYQDGRLACRQHYVDGVLEGECIGFAPCGQATSRSTYRQGKLDGESVFLHEGVVVRRSRYRQGRLEGETREYAPDGTLLQCSPYRADLLHGTVRRFGPQGEVTQQRPYLDGVPQGEWRDVAAPPGAGAGAGKPSFAQRLERWVRG
jgi:antitoxin component YwqK of YwqJK toxin-antitoxin module